VVVGSEGKEIRVESNQVVRALEDETLESVVAKGSCEAAKSLESLDVTTQEATHMGWRDSWTSEAPGASRLLAATLATATKAACPRRKAASSGSCCDCAT